MRRKMQVADVCIFFLISVLGKAVAEDKQEPTRRSLWSLSFYFRSDADLMAAHDYNVMQWDWNKEPQEDVQIFRHVVAK